MISMSTIEGAIYTIIGGVVSLTIKWIIEKKKSRFLWRKGFIDECKKIINKNDFNLDQFIETFYYSNLKVNLSNSLKKEIETKPKRYVLGKRLGLKEELEIVEKEAFIKKKLFDEISTLEKKWGLL